jgi:spore coat protein JB
LTSLLRAQAKEVVDMERMMRGMQVGSQSAALRKIQEIDFALYETILYLDAYPESAEALAYYHSLLDARKRLVGEYERVYSPLTAFSNTSTSKWNWVNDPWPWQYEAN